METQQPHYLNLCDVYPTIVKDESIPDSLKPFQADVFGPVSAVRAIRQIQGGAVDMLRFALCTRNSFGWQVEKECWFGKLEIDGVAKLRGCGIGHDPDGGNSWTVADLTPERESEAVALLVSHLTKPGTSIVRLRTQ